MLSSAVAAGGNTYVVHGHEADFGAQGLLINEDTTLRVGATSDTYEGLLPPDLNGFFLFELPVPGATEQPIVQSARLSFHVSGIVGTPSFSLDLYGLPRARQLSEFDPNQTWYDPTPDLYSGPAANAPSDHTLIQSGLVSPALINEPFEPVRITTAVQAEAILAAYLTSLYEAGGAGQLVMFRLNPDQSPEDLGDIDVGYEIQFAGTFDFDRGAHATNEPDLMPMLELTLVPEPGTGLLALTPLAAGLLRRRRH